MTLPRLPVLTPPAAALAALAVLAGVAAARERPGAPQPGARQPGARQEEELHAFRIYATQSAQALVESAEDHLEARRWSEALVDLQALIEEHRGEVLPASRPRLRGRESLHAVHPGASDWALGKLLGLPPQGRDLYQERFGGRAARALEAAIAAGDRARLVGVAHRWPATEEAVAAWWALGDMELELGNLEAGLFAWGRALGRTLGIPGSVAPSARPWREALAQLAQAQLAQGVGAGPAAARAAFALALLEGGGQDLGLAPRPLFGSALSGGGDYGRLGRARDSWPRPHELAPGPQHPFLESQSLGKYALYPARLGDAIFYSTTRSLHAVGAFTGEELWRTPPDLLGWDSVVWSALSGFGKAVSKEHALVAPAAAQGVVVAPLQIPLVFEPEDSYGDLEIIKVVPERRLFAFDAQSGERIWDTMPARDWDGESGSFSERMSIVGSPTVAGSRLLVPAAMLRGRIELHVGCFDLHTGDLLWSTPLLTGQRELNMFGRLVEEYSAPPVVVSGQRVVVLTQLGTIACLDLFTGETLWQSLYEQIPIQPGTYYNDGNLAAVWHNAPPVVAGGVLVATPFDGRELLGLDLSSGAVLWSVTKEKLNTRIGDSPRGAVDLLLGADERRVYLAGRKVVALESPGGLAREAPGRLDWVYPAIANLSHRLPRPVLTSERVFVPTRTELVVIDRGNGKQVDALPWSAGMTRGAGNLLIGEGMLFSLSTYSLNGFFEWEAMMRRARARVAQAPDDPLAIHDLALLLYKRGLSAMQADDYKGAARHLQDARGELARLLIPVGSDGTLPAARGRRAPAAQTLHQVLRAEARNMRLAADPRGALRSLREALPLAHTPEARRDTLLEEQAVLRDRDRGEWLAVLEDLERTHGEALLEVIVLEQGTLDPAAVPLTPSCASLGSDEPRASLEMPVGMWVLVERARALAGSGRSGDHAREFADLHALLARYPLEPLFDERAGEWAAERIGAKLARGERGGYDGFERRAQAMLERAQSERDRALLEEVPRLYPHSAAANASNDARIELALEAGDLSGVAQIALSGLPELWKPAEASDSQLRHLLSMAQALGQGIGGRRGNAELRAALVAELARHHPDHVHALEGREVRLAELARAWAAPAPPDPPAASFDAGIELVQQHPSRGPLVPVGLAPPGPGGGGYVLLFCDGARLLGFPSGGNGRAIVLGSFGTRLRGSWAGDHLPTTFEDAVATTPGRVHVATLSRVVTMDSQSGDELWVWPSGRRGIESLEVSDGVLVVCEDLGRERSGNVWRAHGLDAASGVELWSLDFTEEHFRSRAVIGEGRLVLLPASAGPGRIYDLFTATVTALFEPGIAAAPYTAQAAWIEDGRLILPYFAMGPRPGRNHLQAFDLESGRLAWRVPLSDGPDGDRQLSEVISWDDRHYLVLTPFPEDDGRRPGLYELNSRLGALASQPVAEFQGGDLLGVERRSRTVLDSPYLFELVQPRREEERWSIRAIHVRYGRRWSSSLPRAFRSPLPESPMPAVSDTTVAFAFLDLRSRPGSAARQNELYLLDRSSGRALAGRELPTEMRKTTPIRLVALGDTLFVCGASRTDFMR